MPTPSPRVLVWNEGLHEDRSTAVRELYPDGIHGALAAAVREHLPAADVATAVLGDAEQGLGEAALAGTDVLVFWSHVASEELADAAARRVRDHVLRGMGLVALHSAHWSKPFRLLMGTSCTLRWRDGDDRELVWTVAPGHPIARGVPNPFALERQEMYGEHFDIPQPDELVFISSFSGGEVFRSGCCFRRGAGRVFYFGPGHETHPVYHDAAVRRVVANAIAWATPAGPRLPALDEPTWSPAGWFEAAS